MLWKKTPKNVKGQLLTSWWTIKGKARLIWKLLCRYYIHRIIFVVSFFILLTYIILPYVGYNFILLRHLCIPPFDGESRDRCQRLCKAHPKGGGCYHEVNLIAEVIQTLESIGIVSHLACGTLLSVHRDGKISFCGDDADITLRIDGKTLGFVQDWKLRKALMDKGLMTWNWFWVYRFCRVDYEETLRQSEECVIDGFPERGRYRQSYYPNITTDAFIDSKYPLDTVEVSGYEFKVPKDMTNYLRELYGKDFMIPDQPNREDSCL